MYLLCLTGLNTVGTCFFYAEKIIVFRWIGETQISRRHRFGPYENSLTKKLKATTNTIKLNSLWLHGDIFPSGLPLLRIQIENERSSFKENNSPVVKSTHLYPSLRTKTMVGANSPLLKMARQK